jgi:putative heme-binding domain-containing protein
MQLCATVHRHSLKRSLLSAFVLSVVAATGLAGQGPYAEADIDYGRRLYLAHCSTCHGADGSAVPSVALASGSFRNAPTDRDLTRIIVGGIPGTAMAGGQYNSGELAGLVAYLRNMNRRDAGSSALGDEARGRALFEGTGGCLRCHRVNGRGSWIATDLSDIGVARTAAALERALVDPARATMPLNRTVRAVTRDGRVVTGRRLNEDTHTVQLIDRDARLVSLSKDDLREYALLTTTEMPSYREMSRAERADLLAYLLSLKGLAR